MAFPADSGDPLPEDPFEITETLPTLRFSSKGKKISSITPVGWGNLLRHKLHQLNVRNFPQLSPKTLLHSQQFVCLFAQFAVKRGTETGKNGQNATS